MLRFKLRWTTAVLSTLACVVGSCSAQERPVVATPVVAQGTPKSSRQPSSTDTQEPASQANNPNPPKEDENPKRILGIIPNFETTDGDAVQALQALTSKQKYNLAWQQMSDFGAHIGAAFQAGLLQAGNGEPHYGQGWGAYGERFAAGEGDQVTSNFFIFGFLPHILKEDPRYFRKGKGSMVSRIYYAASRTVITRTDSGDSTFNVPQVAGQLMQQGISNLYYPKVDRDVSGTFKGWGLNLAYNSGYNVLKEFYPDFLKLLARRHWNRAQPVGAPPSFSNTIS